MWKEKAADKFPFFGILCGKTAGTSGKFYQKNM